MPAVSFIWCKRFQKYPCGSTFCVIYMQYPTSCEWSSWIIYGYYIWEYKYMWFVLQLQGWLTSTQVLKSLQWFGHSTYATELDSFHESLELYLYKCMRLSKFCNLFIYIWLI